VRGAGVETRELRQRDLVERTADRNVELLPGAPDGAGVLDPALATPGRALRERDRSFKRIEDGGGADLLRVPRVEFTRPARCNCLSSLLTVGEAIRVRSARPLAFWSRERSEARLARITVA
jgi:hypothetical protein